MLHADPQCLFPSATGHGGHACVLLAAQSRTLPYRMGVIVMTVATIDGEALMPRIGG
jgi:hypothetical protein